MITKAEAIEQVRRMSNLDFFPGDAKSAGELVEALRDVANNVDHGAAIVNEFIGSAVSGTKCPTAADIRRMAHSLALKEYALPGPTQCATCCDTGWAREFVERRGERYEVARRCECRKVAV